MKRLLLIGVPLISILFAVGEGEANASEKVEFDYEFNDDNILLNWSNEEEKYYELYLDGEIIYSGTEDNFEHSISSDINLNYMLVEQENEVVKDVLSVSIVLENNQSIMSDQENAHPLDWVKVDAITRAEEVTLKLIGEVPNDLPEYEVYRNNELIGTMSTNEDTFTDDNITSDEYYTYTLVGKEEVEEEQRKEIDQYLNENQIVLTEEEKEEVYFHPLEITKVVNTLSSDMNEFIESEIEAFSTSMSHTFTYLTFIPDAYVPAHSMVDGLLSGYQFGGDNRGFNRFSSKYRTKVNLNARFFQDGSRPTVRSSRDIGITNLYDENFNFIESDRAPVSDISISPIYLVPDGTRSRILHSSATPFGDVPTPAIDYDIAITAFSNGSLTITGDRDRAPSHELYVTVTGRGQIALIQAENEGFIYLWPFMPSARINISR